MSKLGLLEDRLAELEEIRDELELNPDDYEEEYCEILRDISGKIKIGSLEYDADYVLRKVDPTAYRVGLLDYLDSIDIQETEEYKEITKEMERIQDEITELELE